MTKKSYSVENTQTGEVYGIYEDVCEEGAIYQAKYQAMNGADDHDVKAFEI